MERKSQINTVDKTHEHDRSMCKNDCSVGRGLGPSPRASKYGFIEVEDWCGVDST